MRRRQLHHLLRYCHLTVHEIVEVPARVDLKDTNSNNFILRKCVFIQKVVYLKVEITSK